MTQQWPAQRKGQALFNAASVMFPNEVVDLLSKEPSQVVDCFYEDENAAAFIKGLARILEVSDFEQVGIVVNNTEFIPIETVREHLPFAVPPDVEAEAVYRRKDADGHL